MSSISFLTFASSDWVKSPVRFKKDLNVIREKYNFFDKEFVWNENDLDQEYTKRFSRYFSDHGFGYWSWKPKAILQVMDKLEYEDFLLYLDGDCFLPVGEMDCFIKDIEKIMDSITKNAAQIGLTTYIDVNGYNLTNVTIVRKQILEKFKLIDNNEFLYGYPHFQSGLILMKKDDWTLELLNEWYQFYIENYDSCIRSEYLDRSGQYREYIHNGGDQAILQCILFKKRPYIASMNFMYKYKVITNNWG